MRTRFSQFLTRHDATGRIRFGLILLLALIMRCVVLIHFQTELDSDPDVYLAIARGIAEGHGYSVPGTTLPTAFRPPLYPLLLTICSGEDQRMARGALQLFLSLATVPVVWMCGRQLNLTIGARLFATALLAVDPLLLRYTPVPMTETFCTLLISILLLCLTRPDPVSLRHCFLSGIAFACCVLSRPTFWAFGMLYLAAWFLIAAVSRQKSLVSISQPVFWKRCLSSGTAITICVAPWVIRNLLLIGTPILMTTHGGYTLLLGNNLAFYHEVVEQPWGTVWDGSHGSGQAVWMEGVQREMETAGVISEVSQDRYQSQLGWSTIRQNPGLFLKACGLKFLWFWNIAPHASTVQSIPPAIRTAVGCWYVAVWCCLIAGGLNQIRKILRDDAHSSSWLAPVCLILAMSTAHLVYWSDARMRAPLMPAIVLLAACAWGKPAMAVYSVNSSSIPDRR